MNKLRYIIPCLLVWSSGCVEQHEKDLVDLLDNSPDPILVDTHVPQLDIVEEVITDTLIYDENGSKYAKGKYKGGKKHGMRIYYYTDGEIMEKGLYNNGKQHGIRKYYHQNGTVRMIGYFENGVKVGERQEFYYDGTPIEE